MSRNIRKNTHSDNNNVFTMQTVQIAPFRTLMTALKDILLETNMTFQPDGIRIINMDKSHTILVHMFLEAVNFEFYECTKEKIIIGVNMFHLFKLINQIDNDDTLIMYIEDSDYDNGIVQNLTLKFENGNINQCKTLKLKLLEPEHDELEVPDVKFSTIINLPSGDFQKLIRDLSYISEKIEIKSVGNELMFRCEGQWSSVTVTRVEDSGTMKFISKQDSSKVIQGEFSLKNLSYFIKCTQLCPQIEMYLENDLPLVVKYNVASLGNIRLGLVPLPSV
jgi:proliferating cell nuclear antigen